jgi:peptidyl-prolyl cis-trans isomerase SurA
MTMRHVFTSVVVLSCLVHVVASAQTLDRVVAIVENDIIMESELNAQVQLLVINNKLDPKTPGLQQQVLESMINEKLIVAKAIEDSVTVTDEEVQQQLDNVIQQRIQQFGSEQRLEEVYGMPISRIRREFRDEMRRNLLAQRLQQQRFGTTQIGRLDVEEFYRTFRDSLPRVPDEVDLAHIYLKPKPSDQAKSAAQQKIQGILDSLKSGSDFAALAKKYSEDPGSAPQGGDLGFVRRGQFVKEFETAAFSLAENQLSGIVETEFGYHIIQLLERRGDAVHARHILVRIEQSKSADESAITLLDSLRTRALKGESFAELAKKYSMRKETSIIGGELGTFELDQLDKDTYAAVSPLKPGDISAPTRLAEGNSYGYHIVLLKKRTPPHAMTLEGDYRRIESLALNYKRTKDYQRWLEELRGKFFWQILQ